MIDLNSLSKSEQIEYRLGKDHYPNLFFNPHIPEAFEIEIAHKYITDNIEWKHCKNMAIAHDGIEYKFNNLGYRSHYDYLVDDLKIKDNILCMGDSDLFGVWIDYHQIWSSLLQENLPNFNIINMGMPGWSADTITRQAVCTIKQLKSNIKYICVLWPRSLNHEVINKKFKKVVSPQAPTDIPHEAYWDNIDWVSSNYNFFKNKDLLKYTAEAHGIRLIELQINASSKKKIFDGDQFGKGLIWHNGHQAIANWFYKKIKDFPSLYESLSGKT